MPISRSNTEVVDTEVVDTEVADAQTCLLPSNEKYRSGPTATFRLDASTSTKSSLSRGRYLYFEESCSRGAGLYLEEDVSTSG